MLKAAAFLGLLGLAAVTFIIVWSGFDSILAALARAGFGILLTSLYPILSMIFCMTGWRILMPVKGRPSRGFMLYVVWLRASVNNLMPVARVGGELVAVRVMTKHGMKASLAVASTIVELTASVLAVFVFDVTGIGLFGLHIADRHTGWPLFAGVLLSLPVIAAFIIVQRAGFFGLFTRIFNFMFRDMWKKFEGDARRFDRAVHAMYRQKKRVLACGFWQFLAWFAGAGEVWLALFFLGHQLAFIKCFMIEALIQASASAAFIVPGALGVQEAGFLLFGQMFGLAPDIAVALAVMRRCRDLVLYVPGLVAWQVQEGHWLLRSKKT